MGCVGRVVGTALIAAMFVLQSEVPTFTFLADTGIFGHINFLTDDLLNVKNDLTPLEMKSAYPVVPIHV